MGERKKNDQFQHACGECMIALERYKLKTNFLGCNMNSEELNQFYNYYEGKSQLRLETAREKMQQICNAFEKNALFLRALQLRTLNNMIKNYRNRMQLMANEPTDYNYAKFDNDENQLMQAIVFNDVEKTEIINKLRQKVQIIDKQCMKTVKQKLAQKTNRIPRYQRAFKIINHSQVRYCRYYETFQRNVANMVNQLHCYIEKLSQFYTVWENLGSSMMYKLKSDREILIDKTMEEKRNRSSYFANQNDQDMMQIIQIMPPNSRLREYYEEALEENKNMRKKAEQKLQDKKHVLTVTKGTPPNIRYNYHSLYQANWYQNIARQRKIITFLPQIILNQKDNVFFKFTYEELHHQTLEYIQDLKRKKLTNQPKIMDEDLIPQRFGYDYGRRGGGYDRSKKKQRIMLQTYNVAPHMNFSCWYDRLGTKGYFSIQDFPMNIVQRRVQFESDRQSEMQVLDEKRKRQYNLKEHQLDNIDHGHVNLGYKFMDVDKQLEYYKQQFTSICDPQYLPLPKPKSKRKDDDFSDSEDQKPEQQLQKPPIKPQKEPIVNIMEKVSDTEWIKFYSTSTQRNEMQLFVQVYMRQLEQMVQKKTIQDEKVNIEYIYLKNTEIETMKKKIKKMSFDKIVLVNEFFCVFVDCLHLGSHEMQLRVDIVWIGEIDHSEKLNKNIRLFLQPLGTAKSQVKKLRNLISNLQRAKIFIIGLLIKWTRSHGELVDLNVNQQIDQVNKIGQQRYVQIKKYIENLTKIQL